MIKIKNNNKHFFITKYKSIFCIEDIIKITYYSDEGKYKAILKGTSEKFNIDRDDQERLVKYIKKLQYD